MIRVVLALTLVALVAFATPVTRNVPCPCCKGVRGPVSFTPPNLGQHDGEIGVTSCKPFSTHRFDVKHDG